MIRRQWSAAIRPLLEALSPRVVVEVGVLAGQLTEKLLALTTPQGAVVHSIDPVPSERFDLDGLRARYGDRLLFHEATSLDVLPRIRDADAVVLDGDHNWYTVYNELKTVAAVSSEERRPFPLTFMDDVDWPYGRRDVYYVPETVPDEFRHEYALGGLVPGKRELGGQDDIAPTFAHALEEGTPRNGVRTALEDFLAESELDLRHEEVVGFHGLAVLVDTSTVSRNAALRARLDELDSPAWLRAQCQRIEQGRLRRSLEMSRLRGRLRRATGRGADTPAR